MNNQAPKTRERVPTGRRGRPSKSMIAAALERPFCAYLHKVCLNNRLEGHKYCIDHIMNDKTAPYRQCTYVHTVTGRRCTRAAHKVDRRASPLCHYHRALKINAPPPPSIPIDESTTTTTTATAASANNTATIASTPAPAPATVATTPAPAPATAPSATEIPATERKVDQTAPTTTPTANATVPASGPNANTAPNANATANTTSTAPATKTDQTDSSIDQPPRHDPAPPSAVHSKNSFWMPKGDGTAVPSEKLSRAIARYNAQRRAQEPTQIELPTMEEVAARHNNADSDTESVDNNLDMFKQASVFTEEELTRTLRDKMIKLRRLYIEQYGHIQYILKEKRLKYIQAQRLEDELYGDAFSFRNNRNSPDYEKLRALLRYHKTFGPEFLLQEQAKRKKMARPPTVGPHHHPTASQMAPQPEPEKPLIENICIFSKTVHGCDRQALPLSPYCRNHILYDKKQVLFRPCAGGIPPCLTPVLSHTRNNRCFLHTSIN